MPACRGQIGGGNRDGLGKARAARDTHVQITQPALREDDRVGRGGEGSGAGSPRTAMTKPFTTRAGATDGAVPLGGQIMPPAIAVRSRLGPCGETPARY